MRKNIFTIGLILLIAVSFTNCATLFGPKKHALAVSSNPHGAEVYVNGFRMGTTPIELNLKADKSYNIEFRKDEYESVTRVVDTKVGAGWVILDILGGVLPIVVDAVTGDWKKLDQDAVNAALVKQ